MRITNIRLFRYRLPLKTIIRTRRGDHNIRQGIIIGLQDESGRMTFGEAAPLPGFSKEDLAQVHRELVSAKTLLTGREISSGLQKLDGGFESWLAPLALSASSRFAIESSVIEMIANERGISLAGVLGAATHADVAINALLTGATDEILSKAAVAVKDGFTSMKLKVGHLSVQEAVETVREVRRQIGEAISLRLDANRAYAISDALHLMRLLMAFDIEYIEEPAGNLSQLRKLLTEVGDRARVALDESLMEIKPGDLSLGYPIKAVVIKPTVLGLERAIQFARSAKANGITAVISSSYESSIGIRVLAACAAAAGPDIPAGLDTLEVLADDLLESPLKIISGHISSDYFRESVTGIRFDLLEEIHDG